MGSVGDFLRELADLVDKGCGVTAEEFEKISKEVDESKSDIEDLKMLAGMLSRRLNALENKDNKAKIYELKRK